MVIYSLLEALEALEDSAALNELADDTGVPRDAARRLVAGLAGLPVRQVLRLCVAADNVERRRRGRRTL